MLLRARTFAICCASLAAMTTPAGAVTVVDAIYSETIQVTYKGLPPLNLSGADPAAPESLTQPLITGTNAVGATSFTGQATTSVGGTGGGVVPQATAEATASFENLLSDGGEGPTVRAEITFELAIETLIPGAPTNLPVPLDFASVGSASVTGDPLFQGQLSALALLNVFRKDILLGGLWLADRRNAFISCGLIAGQTACTGAPQLAAPFDVVLSVSFIPDSEKAFVQQIAQGAIGFTAPIESNSVTGSFSAFIDPIVRISPGFMVEIDGVMVPGDQAYALSYSPNLIPEPASGLLVLGGLSLIALLRVGPRRDH